MVIFYYRNLEIKSNSEKRLAEMCKKLENEN